MNMKQQIVFRGKNYEILNTEQEFIVHPTAFGLLPAARASLQYDYIAYFHMDNYQLIVDKIEYTDHESEESIQYEPIDCKATYNGTILMASDLVKEYYLKSGNMACFSYQKVLELVFENGMLITTVDQSRAMLRIRKNIELGLRSLDKKRDLRCILRFMNSRFVGDYKPFLIPAMRLKYLKEMIKEYDSLQNN